VLARLQSRRLLSLKRKKKKKREREGGDEDNPHETKKERLAP